MKRRPERHARRDIRLLVRYVTGACPAHEAAEVQARLAVDEKLARLLDELEQIWAAAEEVTEEVDVGALRERFHQRIRDEQEGKIKRLHPATSASAASHTRMKRVYRPRAARQRSPWRSFLRVVAVVAVVALGVWAAQRFMPARTSEAPGLRVFATEPGQQASIRLADGTDVRLSVKSRLTVPPTLAAGHREVELEGEAFFEVAPDPDRPFRVRTIGSVVQAIGTAFGVRAYPDEMLMQVVVVKGRIALQPAPDAEALVLESRQMVQIAGGRPGAVREDVDVERLVAWREGQLVFEGAPFEHVARELERWYDVQVELERRADSTGLLTASFTDESLSEMLKVVSLALRMDYRREDRRIIFYPARPDFFNRRLPQP